MANNDYDEPNMISSLSVPLLFQNALWIAHFKISGGFFNTSFVLVAIR